MTAETPFPTVPTSPRSVTAAQVSVWGSIVFTVILLALHLLRTDLDPSWRFISEYELGRYGWLMQIAFFALATSSIACCVALFPAVKKVSGLLKLAGYLGIAKVGVAGVGMALAGWFVPDNVNRLHEVGAMLDFLPFGAPLINWSLTRNSDWRPAKSMLLWTAFLPLLGLLIFMVSMGIYLPRNNGLPGPTVLVGWQNRIMILLHCAWLIPMAHYADRLTARR